MALAATSGATDAIGFLALGQVFTSAMTGNLVLLGIALAHDDAGRIGHVLMALVCYMAGVALGEIALGIQSSAMQRFGEDLGLNARRALRSSADESARRWLIGLTNRRFGDKSRMRSPP